MIDLLRPPCSPGPRTSVPGEAGAERCCGPGQQSRAGRRTDRSTNYSDVIKHRSRARVKHPRHKMLWKTCLLGGIVPLYVVVAGTSRHREDQPCVAPSAGPTRDRVVDSRPSEDGGTIRRRRACAVCGRRFTTFERVEEAPLLVLKRLQGAVRARQARVGPGEGLQEPADPREEIYASPVTSRRRSGPGASARSRARRSGSSPQRPPRAGPGRLHALRQRLQGLPGPGRLRARGWGPRLPPQDHPPKPRSSARAT